VTLALEGDTNDYAGKGLWRQADYLSATHFDLPAGSGTS
jgi:hypothetical protein